MNVVAAFPSPMLLPSVRESRRLATRRQVLLPCQAVRERDFKLIADRTLDVSIDGMLLPIEEGEVVLTGESLVVSFPIPGMWIDAEATVSRVVHGRRPGDDGLAIGVTFDVISPSARAALAGYLHGKPPPLPRRGPLSRLRRGEELPSLADASLMELSLGTPPLANEADVESIDDGEAAGLDVLREVAAAWRKLIAQA